MGLLKSLLNMAVKAAADSLTQKLENLTPFRARTTAAA